MAETDSLISVECGRVTPDILLRVSLMKAERECHELTFSPLPVLPTPNNN